MKKVFLTQDIHKKIASFFKIFLFCFFVLLCLILIKNSSTIGLDGHRYFSLIDDSMISMRFAENFVNRKGLDWNVGQRVEGFTSPLMVFIMSVSILFFGKIYAVLSIQLLGFLLLIGNIYLISKITNLLLGSYTNKPFISFLTCVFCVSFYPIIYWSIMGMDTGLVMTLTLASIFLLLREEERNSTYGFLLPMVLSLNYLARPDSLLFILVVYFVRIIRRHERRAIKLWMRELLVLFFLPLIYQIFRILYYHEWMPNTYVLKSTGMLLVDRIQNGIGFTIPYFYTINLIFYPVITFIIYLFIYKKKFTGKDTYIVLFLLSFLIMSIYQILVGGDVWPPYWRIVAPTTVLLIIAFVYMTVKMWKEFRLPDWSLNSVLIVYVLIWINQMVSVYYSDISRLKPAGSRFNNYMIQTALILNKVMDNDSTIAPYLAGVIPYYTDKKAYDPLGKVDAYIAGLAPDMSGLVSWGGMKSVPGHNKYDLNYTFKKIKPDFIQFSPYNVNALNWCVYGKQNLSAWCKKNYVQMKYRGVDLLLKKGSKHIYWSEANKYLVKDK